jgi:hypothetical protein
VKFIYDNNSLLPKVRSQNFAHSCDKATLVRYVIFSVLLSVLPNVFLFHCLPELYVFSSIVMFQNVTEET